MSDFVVGPMKNIADPPKGNRGGPGDYDGANGHGLPVRTPSPNGVPEKFIERIPGGEAGTKSGG